MQRQRNRSSYLALFLAALLPFAAQAQSCVPSATLDWMVSSDPLAAPIRPAECASVEQNPPDFGWPDGSADGAYQVTLIYPDGRAKTLAAAQNWINWDEVLAPGTYSWQVQLADSSGTRISRARQFTVSAIATAFVVPDTAALLNRARAAPHPRGLPDATSLALMLAERQSAVSALQNAVSSQLSAALPGAPINSVESEVHDEYRRTLNALMAYVYTGQEIYLDDARRRLLNIASWDPRGATSYAAAARASREIAWALVLGYDWLHARLEPVEKNLVLAAIQARGADMYNDIIGPRARIASYPRDSEGQQALVVLAAISTLVAGDLSDADTWLQSSLPLAINATNPWGPEEGGFGNGDAFGTRDVGELLVPWYILRWSAGVDLAQKAWVRNWSRFLAYFLPPGAPSGVFGDGAESALGEPQARFAKGYTSFAPTALGRWHAAQLSGEDATRIEYLLSPLAEVGSSAFPEGTPHSAVFPSLGQAALHSNLADPARTSIYFKSSPAPYGSFDHSHADQNSFVINAGGERLAIGSGYYDGYGTPHWREWYKQTRAHNAITFDGGKGQLFLEQDGKMGYGAITNYGLNQDQDIVHGDATQAYGGALREAKRSIVYLRPNLVLVYDRLASDIPRRWEWNIHALNPMTVVSDRQILIESNGRRLCVDMLAGPAMRFTQTDRFTAEPNGNLPRQWHGNFSSVNRLSATEFIALLDVGCSAAAASASKTGGLWTVLAGNKTVTISDIGISVGPSASSALVSPTEITSPPPLPDTQAPSVPTGLVATAVSSTQVTLTWNASTDNAGVTGYYVYLNNVALATTTATSFTHTGLTAGTTYNYRVSAFDAVPNHSAWTMPVAVTTADTQAPSVPAGLVATAVSSTQITLSWNASTDNVGVTGYTVYLNNAVLARPTETSFSHAGLAPCTTYNYRVSAFDAVPNHSAWTASVAVTTPGADCQAPSVPTGLVVTAVSSTQVNLTWNASADNIGVVGYTVYLNNSVLAHTTETTFSHTGLTAGTTYNYRVSAYDAIPNHSAWTTPVAVTTPPPPDTQAPSVPAGLVATAVSSTQINLTWNASTDNVGVTGYTVYLNNAVLARPTETSFSHAGLAPCTTYNYRVSAFDAVPNHSAWTVQVAVTTPGADCQAPSVPTGLVAIAVASTQVNLTWNASTDNIGVVGYTVYRNNSVLAHTTETTFSHTGLTAGTTYNYRVSAYDAIPNHSAWTTPVAVTTPPPPDTQAPSAPANLAANGVSTSQVNLSWSAATDNVGVSGYRVYRDGALVASPAGTTATITGLSASTVYAFTVAALDAAGNASAQSAPLSVTTSSVPDITAPTVPTGLVATVNSPVNLSWTASTDDVGVAGYRVYRDGALVASPVGTTVTITGLSASTVYAFTVAALDAAGNASAQSAPLSVTTPPAPDATAPSTPAGLTASALTATSLTLSWSAAVDNVVVSGYRVYRDGALVASPAGTTVTITGLSASTVYAFTVAALDAAGNASAQSAPLSVTTPALFSTLDPYLGDLANWEPLTASRWSVVSDGSDLRYGINTTGYSNLPTERLGEYSLVKDRTYGDFAFSARARSTEDLTANPFADYAVVFGLQDANNYYYAIFNRNAASTQLFKVVGGVAQPALATANFAIPDNNYHRVDVVRTGSLITASFDGVPILQASDATFGAGRIGIGGKNDAAWWDDIAIALAAVADTQAPTVPANLSVTQLSASQITLAWSAATDNVAVIGYRVYRDGTLVASPAGTSVAITGLSAGTLYAFSVAALDAAGNASAPSAPLSVTTPAPDLIAPSVPTGLVGTAVSPTQINLTWNAATDNVGVTGYRVYLNDAVLATTTATSFTHTGLAAGTTYNYRVSAHDAVPNHSAWTATPVSVTTPVAPGTPPSAIDSADILSAAHADIPFSQQRGYSVQVLGTFPNVTSIPESGIHGSTLPNGETLRFGKVADPVNSTGKALAFQVSPGDPVTAGSKRAEIKFGNNVEMNKVYWYAVSVYIYDWGSLASGDNGLFAAQLHSGDDSRGLSPSFGLYTAGSNGRSFSVEARWSTSTSPSQGNTVIARYATRPIPFGRWMDFVFKFRQSTSGNGFMQVWLDGAQIVDHQGLLGFNTPGYRDYVKSGYYNWSSAFNSARKVLVRSPVVVLDPTGDKYNADDLRAFLAQ